MTLRLFQIRPMLRKPAPAGGVRDGGGSRLIFVRQG
jgi:hypothetical protein